MKLKCVHCDEQAIVCTEDEGPLCVDHLHEHDGDEMEDEEGEPWGV